MFTSTSAIIIPAMVVLVAYHPISSLAAPTEFANFTEQASGNSFVFTNTGASSAFSTSPDPLLVNFQFTVNTPYGNAGTAIPALLTFSASADGKATSQAIFPGVTYLSQPVDDVTMMFTAVHPVNNDSNLLTVSYTGSTLGGDITGFSGSGSASMTADTSLGDNLSFSSSILSFGPSTGLDENYSLGFTSLAPPNPVLSANGYLASFTGAGTGNFSATTANVVPAPETLPVLVGGIIGVVGLLFVRGRRGLNPHAA